MNKIKWAYFKSDLWILSHWLTKCFKQLEKDDFSYVEKNKNFTVVLNLFLVETSENGTTETPNGTTEEEEAKSENVSSTGTENTKENEPVKEDEKKKEDQASKKVKLENKPHNKFSTV